MVTSLYMCVIVMMLRVYLHVFHTGVNPSCYALVNKRCTPQSSNTYYHTCNNVEVVIDLGKHEPIYHEHARPCSGGDSMNEAVLMKYCFAPKPSNWTQGRKVIEHCSDIPPYTPINMFGFGQNLVISGIFIKCTSATNFMIIHQKDCVGGLHLDTINIQNGSGMFYVIHW